MFKITAIISLVLIATWSHADSRRQKKESDDSRDMISASTMWAASLSCDSCGSECASACGTRHFRSCCFNYLRRKRGLEGAKYLTNTHDLKSDLIPKDKAKHPLYVVEGIPEQWWSNIIDNEYRYQGYPYDDTVEN